MKLLVTGAAGFIGYHLCEQYLAKGYNVVGLDNLNDYYDVTLKFGRLAQLGFDQTAIKPSELIVSSIHGNSCQFIQLSLEDKEGVDHLFATEQFDLVCNLAAQAGVRFSLEQPFQYVDSNITGFLSILESCRNHGVKKLIYASSSSVYGLNEKIPFSVYDHVDHPISLYAATKKANELMAHTYSHLFGIQTVGLRFFTVYGPWGRPDMAMFLFTDAILNDRPIQVFNGGNLSRDFTYIDDIVGGIVNITNGFEKNTISKPYSLYNIGNSKPVKLLDFIEAIEEATGKKAIKEMLPMQPGDVERTWADVDDLIEDFDYTPNTPVDQGVKAFVAWYKEYYSK
ncbi:NAD-dependent epimerase [Flavobacterium lacus]|uniref:UDP-glucuronate 4-epimerase n=1 Tax=Flavobacterium lacus TaxID=1353778 RepID=A0A328X775_9FLAO|nr:NAD-dependent epimerase [Flavobacterium lacus]RAR51149.1 UDP-glucuronate 4-epimerase [Flavobacterium lacus]